MNRHQLAIAHGAFDVVTGVWPLLSLKTFEAVTGPKPEGWLVKTVATAAGLTAIDLYYAGLRRRISPVYLLDAAVEIGLIGAGACAARQADDDVQTDVVRGVW